MRVAMISAGVPGSQVSLSEKQLSLGLSKITISKFMLAPLETKVTP